MKFHETFVFCYKTVLSTRGGSKMYVSFSFWTNIGQNLEAKMVQIIQAYLFTKKFQILKLKEPQKVQNSMPGFSFRMQYLCNYLNSISQNFL